VFGLQRRPRVIDTDAVLRTYTEMYDAYFADIARIPEGQLVELAYEDLERDPMSRLEQVYEALSLGDFETMRGPAQAYLQSVSGYRKNRHPQLDDATREQVATAWRRSFEAWGYPR
jgi:hypothetical protein